MAISDVLKDNGAKAAPKAAPTAAPKAAGQAKSGTQAKTEAFKKQGAAERAKMSEDQKAMEGSKSDKVEFLCALGDPARKQSRQEQNTAIPSYVVVGYKFKVLEDGTVPYAPIKDDWKTPLDVEPISSRPVKAGDVVALNIVETADFISRIEYAGKFTGGNIGVYIGSKIANDRVEPLPVLNKEGKGSIKENMELVADMVGGDGTSKGGAKPVVKEEYADTFGVLYRRKSLGNKSAGSSKARGETQAELAAAFRALYSGKRA